MDTKIGLIVIGTNKYERFITPLIDSARKFFFNENGFEVNYFVFTDKNYTGYKTTTFYLKHETWPYITLKRFHAFVREKEPLSIVDYLFYCDVDMRFMQHVGSDILSNFSATIHPYFYNTDRNALHYEKNPSSLAFVPPDTGRRYYAGGFYGGATACFLSMANQLQKNIDADLKKGIIALWHDESHLNKYLAYNPPEKELDPSYCYPEGQDIPFEMKIMALNKPKKELREECHTILDRVRLVAHRMIGCNS